MIILVLALLFGLFGAAIGEGEGLLAGAMLGGLLGMLLDARGRLGKLEKEHHALLLELRSFRLESEQRWAAPHAASAAVETPAEPDPAAVATRVASQVAEQEAAEQRADAAQGTPQPDERGHVAEAPGTAPSEATGVPQPVAPASSPWREPPASEPFTSGGPFDAFGARLRSLLFGGNTIVRAGILVLLVGVALLLRYAAEHSLFPIELRMAAAGLIAIALTVFGYLQRTVRPGFGRSLQGGGVAGLYLVVFFAYRAYQLLPAQLAVGLLVSIAIASGVLAVVQDAAALIVIGQIGGFMAPVLASSGGGSHVTLFSYYLLLNLLVFAVSWFKPWRALNLVGFAFTFGIGSTWGALRYRAEDFASTEPFLLAFFLLYSLIPVLYALRRPDGKRGWVDASLVFGTPLAVLLLQYAMVHDVPFGMAYSALGLAAFYVLLSRVLWKRAPEALRSLVESFLAIGIGFATLAIPYGFDNHDLTGASWALEGAGLYWVGGRQKRWISRLTGAALQLMAAGAMLVELADSPHTATLPVANARFLASMLLCLSSLFVAQQAHARRAQLFSFESYGLQLLVPLGLTFFLGNCVYELEQHASATLVPGSVLAVLAGTAIALELTARRAVWFPGRLPGALLMALLPVVLLSWEESEGVHPLGHGGALGFPLSVLLCVLLLARLTKDWPRSRLLHAVFAWYVTSLAALEMMHVVRDFAGLGGSWPAATFALVLSAGLTACALLATGTRWPFRAAPDQYLLPGAGMLTVIALFWSLWANTTLPGDSAPLPYLPVLNPLDLAQLALLVGVFVWHGALVRQQASDASLRGVILPLAGLTAFFWLNALLARSVHQLAGVPFDPDALWNAVPLQVSLSISWSLLGLLCTALGHRRQLRWLWLLGAVLLAVVVMKLFTLDLARLSTPAKIGTFMVVGLLLVSVGYVAPVPPPRGASPNDDKLRS